MKELSIEEKARRYDEAIKLAKDSFNYPDYPGFIRADVVFPELKESEDERIIKAIKSAVLQLTDIYLQEKYGLKQSDCIAWLEKQGEHTNFRNKIQISDKVTRNEDGVLVNLSQLKRVAKKDEKQGEQKPLGFNIGDEITVNGQICKVVAVEQKPAEWSRDDDQYLLICKNALYKYQVSDKWDANIIYQWLEDKVKSSVQQPKQEWSERDELMLGKCIDAASGYYSPEDKQPMKDWLKSLRPQSHWKPSDEQMAALKDALNDAIWQHDYKCSLIKEEVTRKHAETIESLYNDLKKLK